MYNLRSRDQVKTGANVLFVDEKVFPQTLAVIKTRAGVQGIKLETGNWATVELSEKHFGVILQYPNSEGNIENYSEFTALAHTANCKVARCSRHS